MTIIQLETFLKIAETKSFTTAANSLGYAQSTVTMQIKQLEEELGTELFERLGKTILLTPAGERLMLYAEKMLQLEREIHLAVPESEEPSGILKLGISESFCYSRLPRILMELKEQYPKLEVRIQFILHENFRELLKKGELDLVYTLNPCMNDENLNLLYKRPEKLNFYACPSHPLTRKKKVTEADLEGVPLLLTGHTCSFRRMVLTAMEEAGVTPEIGLETSSKEILKQFAINGLGVAFIPDMSVGEELRNGSLVRLNWKGADFPVFSQIFVHKGKRMNRAVEEFVRMVTELEKKKVAV